MENNMQHVTNTQKEIASDGEEEIKSSEKDSLKIALQIMIIGLIAYLNFILFSDKHFLGLVDDSLLLNPLFICIFMLILFVLVARHLIRIKLILYRIFLQTFLSQSSRIYKFFSHGLLVRMIGLLVSAGLVIQVFIYMSLIPVHLEQYIGLCIGFSIFWILRARYMVLNKDISFIRSDLNMILKSYLMPFALATATGLCIALWEIYHIDEIHHIKQYSEALEISLASIDPDNDFFWRPIRIAARHIYVWEILIQQIVNIPLFGKILYCVYLIISQGAITFFAIFLMAMPYKMEVSNEGK